MSYSHVPTDELLDLADDYLSLTNYLSPSRVSSARQKLAEILAEIERRRPAEEFRQLQVTYDDNGTCHYCGGDALWGDAPHERDCPALPDGIVGFELYIPEEAEADDISVCDPEVYKNGVAIAIIADRDHSEIEALVQKLTKQIGIKMDWHYVAGRAVVKAIGDLDKARDAFRPYTNGYLMVVEDDGTWTKEAE